jgi:hypothetical protein
MIYFFYLSINVLANTEMERPIGTLQTGQFFSSCLQDLHSWNEKNSKNLVKIIFVSECECVVQ